MNKENVEQFDFLKEKDKLQREIKDKLLEFISKCGTNKVEFEINPRYIEVGFKQELRLVGLDFKITLT